MKWSLGKYDRLKFPIWEKRDLIALYICGFVLGFLVAVGLWTKKGKGK